MELIPCWIVSLLLLWPREAKSMVENGLKGKRLANTGKRVCVCKGHNRVYKRRGRIWRCCRCCR